MITKIKNLIRANLVIKFCKQIQNLNFLPNKVYSFGSKYKEEILCYKEKL